MRTMELPKDNQIVAGGSCQNEEGIRSCRFKKRQSDPTCCPICSVTIRDSEIYLHLNSEIEKLNKLHSTKVKCGGKHLPSSSSNRSSENNTEKIWEIFQKVRSNRQSRQRSKHRKRRAEACPVCNKEINEDLTLHVELCLRTSEANGSESDENIDVEAFEEYEWAGQSRIRATSLLESCVSNLGTSVSMAEDDEVLNVDVDDSQMYGSPQYSETDVILPCQNPENVALRKAVTGIEPKKCFNRTDFKAPEINGDPILQVLKNKIRELESRESNKDEVYKCLICMERYQTPVISVCCWHVHCEECWLQTLGVKKLCPQCNMITSPSDLRRIYM